MRNQWYVACRSDELKHKPLASRILSEPLVLFRDASGRATALLDRCPHRNVQLSLGTVKEGTLSCAYHGWSFDASGRCVGIPALCDGQGIPSGSTVPQYPVQEQDGYIWVFIGDQAPDSGPFAIPHRGEWAEATFSATVRNEVGNVIENFIDCAHTGYVHGGLFRDPASKPVRTVVREVEDGIVIDIDEEAKTNSLLGRLLIPKGAKVEHQDRFIMPSIVQVAYSFGPSRRITGYQICTPVDAFETKVYVHVLWKLGLPAFIVRPLVKRIGRTILAQDLGVLENQGEQIQRYGAKFCSTPADTANLWIQAFRARAEAPKESREKEVRFRL